MQASTHVLIGKAYMLHICRISIKTGCVFEQAVPVQAAFKRPVTGNGSDASAVDSATDWDAVKAEDRTLIEQACLPMLVFARP